MNPRTTGILFLIAAALGAFVWFYEIRGEADRKDAEAAAKRLFPGIEASAVDQIELTTSDGQRARLERSAVDWRVAQPLAAPADGFVADAIASALVQLGSEAVYENPQPLAVYGLDDAGRDVRFSARGADHVLRLGHKTPIGGNHYAFVEGQSRVYAVSGIAVNAFSKSLDELREKRILRFDAASVQRITLRWPAGKLVLERSDGGWRLVEPLAGPADETTVDELLSNLSFLRASSFVDAPTPAQARALEPPELAVELAFKAGEKGEPTAPQNLVIGARDGGQGDRLVRAGGPGLFRLPSERLQDFRRDVDSYRFRELARFDPDLAERLEIAFQPAGAAALTLTATRADGGWTSTPEAIEPAKLATLVDELSRLRGAKILADGMGEAELRGVGLAPPNVRFTVTGKSGQLVQVDLGLVRGSDGVIAKAAASATVYLLAPTVADYLPVSLEALRSRFVQKPSATKQADAAPDAEPAGAPDAPAAGAPEAGEPEP